VKNQALLPALLVAILVATSPITLALLGAQAQGSVPMAADPAIPEPAAVTPRARQPAPNPLAPFERLIGGQWHLDGSYSEFEWGLGRLSVSTHSYFIVEGEPKLVSEGIWFWHPGEKSIKGAFTAIDMPVVFFDYTVRFEGNKMVTDLVAFDAEGNEAAYVETWEFTDETHYVWKLLSETPDGLQEVMGGTYERKE